MKKSIFYSFCLCSAFMVCSCVNLEKLHHYPAAKIDIPDKYIQEKDNMVDVNFILNLDKIYTTWHDAIKLVPAFYQDQTKKLELPPMIIEGVQHLVFNERMEKFDSTFFDGVELRSRYSRRDMCVTYNATIPYSTWMKSAALYADLYANAYNKEVYLGRILITNGLFDLTPLISFDNTRKYYYQSGSDSRIVRGGKETLKDQSIIFRLNSSDLEADKVQEKSFEQFIRNLNNDNEVRGYELKVSISNSPEGSVQYNQSLGENRLQTIKAYLSEIGIGEKQYSVEMITEGWERLLILLPGLNLQNRDDIENVIRTTADFDERERIIHTKYPVDYRTMANEIFPLLRYGDVTVSVQYKGLEGISYLHSNENVSVNGEKGDISSFVKLSGEEDNVTALHSRMLDAIKEGNSALALNLAAQIPANVRSEVIRYNKALLLMDEQRYSEAKALMATIHTIPEAKYNLGVIQLMYGEYSLACDNLSDYIDINAAIAKIYVGKNKDAIGVLMLLDKSAERDYLLALAHARINEPDTAKEFLSAATSISQTLKQKAVFEPDFNY